MTRYITRKETQRVFDKCIKELLEGQYERAVQRYDSITGILQERAASPYCCRTSNFGPHYLVAGLGKGIAEGLIEKRESAETRDISDIAKEAKSFYNAFKAIEDADWGSASGFEAYRTLGKSYVFLGLEKEGIEMLERLKQPRIMDIVKLKVKAGKL